MSLLSGKRKTGIVSLFVTVGIVVMAALQYRAVTNYQALGEIRALVSDLESDMLTLRRNEKDFLARKDLRYLEKFSENYNAMKYNLQTLGSVMQANEVEDAHTDQLMKNLHLYQNKFHALVDLQKKIGFTPQDGLYGRLRDAIHRVEDLLTAQQQDRLGKDMLMLRRREKDFMLRNDTQYIEQFDLDMTVMQSDLLSTNIDHSVKTEIAIALAAYEKNFKELVSATQQMGLSSDEGLQGEMRLSVHQGEEFLDALRGNTLLLVEQASGHLITQLLAFGVVLLLFMIILIR